MEKQLWVIGLEESKEGGIAVRGLTCSSARNWQEILRGRYSDADVLFQELLTLLDSSIWSFIATWQVKNGQPTLGGYEG